jgi:hypothetical protein
MALALAFASNDLVNFIGVFMAGLVRFRLGKAFSLKEAISTICIWKD